MKKAVILFFICGFLYADEGQGLKVDNIQIGRGISISTFAITSSAGIELLRATTGQVFLPAKLKVQMIEVESSGLRSHGRGKFKGADVEIEDANRGLILTSSGTIRWLLWVDDTGSLFTTQIAASPEVSFEERKNRIKKQKKAIKLNKKRIEKSLEVLNSSATVDEKFARLATLLDDMKGNTAGVAVAGGSGLGAGAAGGGIAAVLMGLISILKKKKI